MTSNLWSEVHASAPFQELTRRRRRFVVPALVATMGTFFAFVLLSAYAGGFIGASLYRGLTVGMVLLVVQYVGIYLVTFTYLRKSKTQYAPLAERVAGDVAARGAALEDSATETRRPERS